METLPYVPANPKPGRNGNSRSRPQSSMSLSPPTVSLNPSLKEIDRRRDDGDG